MTVYCRKVDFSVNLDGTWLFCIGKIFYTPKICSKPSCRCHLERCNTFQMLAAKFSVQTMF